ncbi:MAG: bifunctional oligoribonuclease/PAP phosphatase NrnA, partial [Polaribacter sp.]|nr:bifunctional oligoribonuclease/PAP phosphatase NrnA [Polaribacter sp.]
MILKGFEDLKRFLEKPKNIVIVGHRNPDGDAMGSSMALKYYLDKKGHQATVIVPNEYPEFLHWLPGADKVYRFDKQNSQSLRLLNASDIVFLLDFNALHRVGFDMQATLEKYKNDFVMIDHHQQPDSVKYMYSDVTICSTSQMVYQFIEMNGDLDLIDPDIASCLYTGIMTDTGSFRFRSTTSSTH